MDARTHYREAATCGASKVGLVVLLYEQAIQDLRRAVVAMKQGDVRARTEAISHALTIIGHLQGTLDREGGVNVSRVLDRFYNSTRIRLMDAQVRVSQEILNDLISGLLTLRDAWAQVELATKGGSPHSADPVPEPSRSREEINPFSPQTPSVHWTG